MTATSTTSTRTIADRNAANAQHSTGPVTPEGKARSAQNATTHGLAGRTVVLPHESRQDYDALKAAFLAERHPGTVLEMELLNRMVDCWWRLTRAMRVEAEFLEQRAKAINEANPNLAGDAALASMFADPAESRSFRLFMRYLTNAQNAWRQACAEFDAARNARLEREEEEAMMQVMFEERLAAHQARKAASASTSLPASSQDSGFVSQSAQTPSPVPLAPAC